MKKNFFAAPIVVITVLGGLLIILAFTIKNNYQQNPQSHHPEYLQKESVSNNTGTVDNNNKNIVDGTEINTANIEYAYRKKSCSDKLIEHLGYTVSYNSE